MSNRTVNCPNCQVELEPEDRFCKDCGASMGVRKTPRVRQSDAEGEDIVGIVPQVVEVKGILGLSTEFMTMIVTSKRLILAVQPEKLNEQHTDLEEKYEAYVIERETTWREFMDSYDFYSEPWMKYQTWHPDDIVAEQPGNRCIEYPSIEDAVLELYTQEEDHMDSLKLKVGGNMLDLSLPWGNGHLVQKVLSEVMEFSVVRLE